MKILYVITSADHGGAQEYTLALAKKFEGKIAAGSEHAWLFEEARRQNVPTLSLRHLKRAINPWHDIAALFELRKLFEQEQPEIIHVSSTKAGFLVSLAAKKLKIPVIYTVHGFVLNEAIGGLKKALYAKLERIGAKYRAHTIAVSKADYEAVLAAGAASPEACSVIYNGLGAIDFLGRGAARQQLGLPPEGIVVGSIANLYPNKGIDVLINAAAQLNPEIRNQIAQVAVIGVGPEKAALNRIIKTQQLESFIALIELPSSHRAANLLKAFDIFVLPSRKEGFPFALLEAMQAGLPIIATNVGGVREALGSKGFVIPPEQPTQLARSIESLVREKEARISLSQTMLEQAKQFNAESMLYKTAEIYAKNFRKK